MACFTVVLLLCSFTAHQILVANSVDAKPLVLAFYVFGDSGEDAGNNKYLKTEAQPGKFCSIDLKNEPPRFTNGKTGADIMAELLGLPLAPAYLSLSESQRSQITTGINYASGACGILETTRAGDCLSLSKQIEHFSSTVKNDLLKAIRSPEEVKHHLAKSIVALLGGNNHYAEFVNHGIFNKYPLEDIAKQQREILGASIQVCYDLGARKFLMLSFGAPCTDYTGFCRAKYFADKLPAKIQEWQSKFPGSLFTRYDGTWVDKDVKENPAKYGFKHASNEPYVVNNTTVCSNRMEYTSFDGIHGTEALYEIGTKECFSGTHNCFPLNIMELAKVP